MSLEKLMKCKYVEQLIILAWTIIGCVPISEFALLVCFPVLITISVVGINICAITAGIEKL